MNSNHLSKIFSTRLDIETACKLRHIARERRTTPYALIREIIREQLAGVELPNYPSPPEEE